MGEGWRSARVQQAAVRGEVGGREGEVR